MPCPIEKVAKFKRSPALQHRVGILELREPFFFGNQIKLGAGIVKSQSAEKVVNVALREDVQVFVWEIEKQQLPLYHRRNVCGSHFIEVLIPPCVNQTPNLC